MRNSDTTIYWAVYNSIYAHAPQFGTAYVGFGWLLKLLFKILI